MHSGFKTCLSISSAVATALSLTSHALAQGAADAAVLEEVVITAQKREENLQSAPIAVSALSGADLARAGVKDFSNLAKLVPEISFVNVAGANSVGIRGVRASSNGAGAEYPTAIHLDGVFLSRSWGLQGLFYDLQRVEVLQGPQGTLYGRNATGGVINIVTQRPKNYFEGYAEVEAGSDELYRVETGVSLPLADTLAVRIALRKYEHDGYYDLGFEDANQTGGRISALWTPTERLSVFASADYQVSDRNGGQTYGISVVEARTRPGNLPPLTGYVVSDPFDVNQALFPALGPQQEYQKTRGANVQADYDLGFATLTGQVGYRKVEQDVALVSAINPATRAAPGYSLALGGSESTSTELRLTSTENRRLQWVGGLYYFSETNDSLACVLPSFTAPRNACVVRLDNPSQDVKSYAVFGQATWTPAVLDERLHLTLGLRYNYDEKDAQTGTAAFGIFSRNGVFTDAAGVGLNGAVVPDELSADWERTTGKIGAAFDITDQNMVFANVSTGYQAGGFAFGTQPQFKPETITAYELGSKNRFLDERLQVNVDLFRYDYENQTQTVRIPPDRPGIPFLDLTVVSIGKLVYEGASLETIFAPGRRDRFDLDLEYLRKANYKDFVIPAKFVASPPLNMQGLPTGQPAGVFTGARVNNAPKWRGRAGYTHIFGLSNGFELEAHGDVQFADTTYLSQAPAYPGTLQSYARPAYASGDLSFSLRPDNERWQLTAYVNNVTDERTVAQADYDSQTAPATGLVLATYMPPRTYGLMLRAGFGAPPAAR